MSSRRYACDDLIVGAGMQGVMAAHACVSQARDCILIDKGQRVGGVLRAEIVDDVQIDAGCHLWGVNEAKNIEFIEQVLGVPMIAVKGHCEISVSYAGEVRRKLSVPSFETLPESVRRRAIDSARAIDDINALEEPIGKYFPRALGTEVSELLLGISRKLYGRNPEDLSIVAANQMAIGRIKLHTCAELESHQGGFEKFDPLLCSHPLSSKGLDWVKFRYPRHGVGEFVDGCEAWMRGELQKLLLGTSPRSISFDSGNCGGVLSTASVDIHFERLVWCCNPLALGSLIDFPLPSRESTAGSPYRVFFFDVLSASPSVEYSHDFSLGSPMFRAWFPPGEMTADRDGRRYAIVECPGAKGDPATAEAVRHQVGRVHGIGSEQLRPLGAGAQVRFFPTVTYLHWLRGMVEELRALGRPILLPDIPLYGKEEITEWWAQALA